MGSYPGSTQDRSCERLGKQAAAQLPQAERDGSQADKNWCKMEENRTLKPTAETENCCWESCFLIFDPWKIDTPFRLHWAIPHSSSSPQLFQPICPTNLAFETLQILGPHLIFSLKPRCFLVAAGCCYWVWRKTNGLQAVWLSNGTRRRPTYIRWASETAVPTKNLIEGRSVRRVQLASSNDSRREVSQGRAHSLHCASVYLGESTQAHKLPGDSCQEPRKTSTRYWIYTVPPLWFYCPDFVLECSLIKNNLQL